MPVKKRAPLTHYLKAIVGFLLPALLAVGVQVQAIINGEDPNWVLTGWVCVGALINSIAIWAMPNADSKGKF